jgi:hypothetical protein
MFHIFPLLPPIGTSLFFLAGAVEVSFLSFVYNFNVLWGLKKWVLQNEGPNNYKNKTTYLDDGGKEDKIQGISRVVAVR